MIFTFNTWPSLPAPWRKKKLTCHTCKKKTTPASRGNSSSRPPLTSKDLYIYMYIYGGFLKWWYPTTNGVPTKNDHFGVFWGYPHLRKQCFTLFFLFGEKWPLDRGLLGDWFSDLLDSKSSESHLSERKLFLDQLAGQLVVDLDVQSYP